MLPSPLSRFHLWICVCTAVLVATAAHAQTVFDQNGFGTGRGTYSQLPYEHVDPLSGNLIVSTTDLTLPGNGGLDLVVQRVYNSSVYPKYSDNGDTRLDEDSWAGIGWRLHFGRVLHEGRTGSGQTVIEMGDGSSHPLYTTTQFPAGWMTKDFWVYSKTTHALTMPNGRVYTFGREVYIPNLGNVRYVTEIRDQYNNAITFSYFGAGGPPDGVQEIVQDLGKGQIRRVQFTYNASLNSLATMRFGDSIWTYTQTPFGPAGYSALRTVQPPAGAKPWQYEYESQTGFVGLTSMQAPSGGVVSYTYGDSTRTAGVGPTPGTPLLSQLTRVVTTRSISGDASTQLTAGTWTFSYNQGPYQNQTIVDCPCGKTVYRYRGIGVDPADSFAGWASGLLAERQVLGPSDQVMEREVMTWRPSEPISDDALPGKNGVWTDPKIFVPLLQQRVLQRGTLSWTTEYGYRSNLGNYNDFGQPHDIYESGGYKTRHTVRTFWYGSPYLAGRIASTSVTVGTQTSTSTAQHDATTGNVTSQNVNGITTSFAYHSNGNLLRVTDAHGHETRLVAYDWGQAIEIQAPSVTSYRQVSEAGLITRDQVGALITNYTYDLAFRPTLVSPPNANSIEYTYDGLWDGWTRMGRGSSVVHTVVDGFGRPVSTRDRVEQKTLLRRDACGRVIFQALPYRNGVFASRGIETIYDVLGRVTKRRFVNNSGVGSPVPEETTYAYNGLDITITDQLGRVTKQEYAAIGGPGDAVLVAVVDPANQRTTYSYDIGNRLTQVAGAVPARSWTYDVNGLLLSRTQPESGTITQTYDAAGLLKTKTDALNQVFTMTYDAADRLTFVDGPGTASDITMTYDALGRLSTQSTVDVVTTFEYDLASRQSVRRDVFSGTTYESRYVYDNNDNISSVTYPSGRVIGYSYDLEDRLTGVTQNGSSFAHTFLYDDGGGLASYVTGAVTHQIDYDIKQRVERLRSGVGTTTPLDRTLTYNQVGQVTAIWEPRFGTGQAFQYDLLNRMTRAQGPWGDLRWTYDAAGNRLTEYQGGLTSFNYDTNQRLTSFTTATGGESYTYDALGRLTSDGRGLYTYTPDSRLATATGTNVAASYVYDAEAGRIRRSVNGIGYYTIRGLGGNVLSEYESRCGTPVWTRDVVFAGSRAIGAIKAPSDLPTIALTTTSSSVSEAAGSATVTVRLTTPNGAPTTCAVSVSYRAVTHAGEAERGPDFGGVASTLSFPAGTANGATQTITTAVKQDAIYEGHERFSIDLTGATGAQLGAASHIVTIVDDDALPTLTINNVQVAEGAAAQAVFTLTLSAASALQAEVNYITSPESAKTNVDYSTTAGRAIIPAGQTQVQVAVPIIDDVHAEIPETFTLQLSSPLNATLGATFGRATIVDNEPRTPIDPTYPGTYFPDITTDANNAAYLPVFNPHTVPVTARVTFTRPNGTGAVRDFVVPAQQRVTVDLAAEPQIAWTGDVSAVVQSLDPARPLVAESTSYWETDWRGGRNTRGRITPSPTWYFAEGATGMYDEYITVFNPANEPVNVLLTLLSSVGPQQFTIPIESGPGRVKIHVNSLAPALTHGTSLQVTTLAGAPSPVVAERTMYWQNGDKRDGHSANGASTAGHSYFFAEGALGAFTTYVALANPHASASTVRVTYLFENGTQYQQTETVPAYGRIEFSPALPGGGFAFYTESLNGVGYVAERVMYGGPNNTLGDAETGVQSTGTAWKFAEGAASSFFTSFLLLGNTNTMPANVTLTFRLHTGATVTSTVTVPARARATVHLNAIPGLSGATFATEVSVTNGVSIFAERAMFWPSTMDGGAHVSFGRPW